MPELHDKQPIKENLLTVLAQYFEVFGHSVYGVASPENASPLYAFLSLQVAHDPEVLSLVAGADLSTTVPNLFFGAVHDLLLRGIAPPLVAYYPDLTTAPRPREEAYPDFRAFCLEHAEEIHQMVTTRYVQTNEVGRCAGLLLAFTLLTQRHDNKPLALVEIGSSAGLHLLFDRYHYDYGAAGQVGDALSPVQIVAEARGEQPLPVPKTTPAVVYRTGVDIHPIDVRDEGETRWLRALIWPEHADRRRQFEAALTLARQTPPQIVAGSAPDVLPDVLAAVPEDALLCIYHSYALSQMPAAVRNATLERLAEHATKRDLYRIAQEGYSTEGAPAIHLFSYEDGAVQDKLLARVESHGRWIEWLSE